ncbi:SARP family transcriptional regulator [Deinococcus detaillensis]|uniref:SARP family transcriptional regulator n=1 Tax=Deinococcus detaillensis TaxID=2592048 RepID=A0A553V4H1_9DEIO|nr:tetratricopeptide repeat protein [Deinococcus detaillensis]TSA87390.1 SARP family transcriptional regulator [Deinococcus detaillensis]
MTTEARTINEALAAFEHGQYKTVITLLTDQTDLSPEGLRVLGNAYVFSGHFEQAEEPLERSSRAGDEEGMVEYGNFLRLTGRLAEASSHFMEITPKLSGELFLRAQRWWGTVDFLAGRTEMGLQRCEIAWHGYMALGDDELIGRVTQTIAQMHLTAGDLNRAGQLYQEAIRRLPLTDQPIFRISALGGLAEVQISLGEVKEARKTLDATQEALQFTDSLKSHVHILSVEAEYYRLFGDQEKYTKILHELQSVVEDLQDFESSTWTAASLADLYSLRGDHSLAMETLYELAPEGHHPLVIATRGMLLRRRRLYGAAIEALQEALDSPRLESRAQLRSLLHLADAQAKNGDTEGAGTSLKLAMEGLLAARDLILYSPDIAELSDLAQHALLEPDLSPYMEVLLGKLAALMGRNSVPDNTALHLRIQTLGRAAVFKDGEEIKLSLQGSVLTLVYLALNPSSTRKELEATLYPDREGKTAGDYFRAVFRELRVKLGQEVLWMDGSPKSPHYRLGPGVHVDLDTEHLREALRNGDTARALSLYRGPFLPDSKMESDWVDDTREELRRSLSAELRSKLQKARDDGDLRRALLLANQSLKLDPGDLDMLEIRVAVAHLVASPQDLARYVVELQRQMS